MRVFERVIVIGVGKFRPRLVVQADHRIQRRPIPRGIEIEGQRLSLASRKPEMIVVGRPDGAVDQKRKLHGLGVGNRVVGFFFERFSTSADIKPSDCGTVRRDETKIVPSRLGRRIQMQADANEIVSRVKDFGLQLCTDKPDFASVLKILAFDSNFDMQCRAGLREETPLEPAA